MMQTNREYCLVHPDELLNMTCAPGGLCSSQELVSWRETHGLRPCWVTSCGECKQEWLGFERDETIEGIKKDAERDVTTDLVDDFLYEVAAMVGVTCDGMVDDVQEAIDSELNKRLMPEGMEWPKDRNENPFDPRKLYDRGCGAVDYVLIGFVNGEQWASVESHDGIDLLPEELGDCEAEVLGADGLPIKVGETVYGTGREQDVYKVTSMDKSKAQGRFVVECVGNDGETCMVDPSQLTHTPSDTQERIDDDATMPPLRYYAEKIGHDVDLKDDEEVFTAVALSLLCRQRELDAHTMGGDAS